MSRWRAGSILLLAVNAAACFADPPTVSGVTSGGPTGTDGGDTEGPAPTAGVSASSSAATTGQPARDSTSESESGDDAMTSSSGTGEPVVDTDPTSVSGPAGSSTTGSTDDGAAAESSSSTGGPAEWTCYAGFYGTDDGCDCGCGIVDPDCEDATVDSCDYCSAVGSCGEPGGCPSNIAPDDNATCVG